MLRMCLWSTLTASMLTVCVLIQQDLNKTSELKNSSVRPSSFLSVHKTKAIYKHSSVFHLHTKVY